MMKLFNILLNIVVAIFIALAALLMISSFDIPGLPLDARTVLTGSMEPTLPTGSIVFIYPQDTYAKDDIVTYQRTDSQLEVPITHRIIEVETGENGETLFKTKGDANDYPDFEPVRSAEISGKVIFHLPFIGRLLDAAKTPIGFAALIVIPALLVIMDEIKKIIGYLRGRKEEETAEQKPEEK
jgi:signal peptidase